MVIRAPDMVVIVEGRSVSVALFGPGLADIVKECCKADMQFRRWTGFKCTEIVFPDCVDVVEILSDPDPFLQFRNDVSEQTG